jgi:hypothetical protein
MNERSSNTSASVANEFVVDRSLCGEDWTVYQGPVSDPWAATAPFKANQDRRHHIPKQRHRVTNWAAYDIALRQRGSLTVWFTEAAIAAWLFG